MRRSFALRPEAIARILEAIRDDNPTPRMTAECFSGISLEPSSIDELLTISNVGDYKIKSFKIEAYGDPTVTVTFNAESSGPPIRCYVSGSHEQVVRIHERLQREVSQIALGRWSYLVDLCYSWHPFWQAAFFFLCGIAGMAWVGRDGGFQKLGNMGAFEAIAYISAAYVGFGLLGIILPLVLLSKVFPRGVFLIGGGVQEYESVKFRRQAMSLFALVSAVCAGAILVFLGHWVHL